VARLRASHCSANYVDVAKNQNSSLPALLQNRATDQGRQLLRSGERPLFCANASEESEPIKILDLNE
jgi:hypothetical protein